MIVFNSYENYLKAQEEIVGEEYIKYCNDEFQSYINKLSEILKNDSQALFYIKKLNDLNKEIQSQIRDLET